MLLVLTDFGSRNIHYGNEYTRGSAHDVRT